MAVESHFPLAQAGIAAPKRPRGLWLARELPFPLDCGDKIYCAYLAKALADAGVDLTLVGLKPDQTVDIPLDWPVRWEVVEGQPNALLRSLLSRLPLVAAAHETQAYRAKVAELAKEEWDFVVFDHYGTGWALPFFIRGRSSVSRTVFVHIAHNHEASVSRSLLREFEGSPLKRLGIWQNYVKTKSLERRIIGNVDLVTAITEDDARAFLAQVPEARTVVLTPGYSGRVSDCAAKRSDAPKIVLMVGSYRWLPKQENLRHFIALADPIFAERGIELHIVGSIAPGLRARLEGSSRATRFHGYVEDIWPYLQRARIAVVPEVVGGGFKLKLLDYIFGGVPVAALDNASVGLPRQLRSEMLCRETLEQLVAGVCEIIDDVDKLDRMRSRAVTSARSLFRWEDRGRALLSTILDVRANAR